MCKDSTFGVIPCTDSLSNLSTLKYVHYTAAWCLKRNHLVQYIKDNGRARNFDEGCLFRLEHGDINICAKHLS
jgi:hypothetical protein